MSQFCTDWCAIREHSSTGIPHGAAGDPHVSDAITDDERMSDENDHAIWVNRLLDAARRGEVLDLQAGAPAAQYNPATANEWTTDRRVPASAIRAVMLDVLRGEHSDLDPRGVRIKGARITGSADFTHINFGYPLHFIRCCVEEPIDLGYTFSSQYKLRQTLRPKLLT